jgi:hypothetical protein
MHCVWIQISQPTWYKNTFIGLQRGLLGFRDFKGDLWTQEKKTPFKSRALKLLGKLLFKALTFR